MVSSPQSSQQLEMQATYWGAICLIWLSGALAAPGQKYCRSPTLNHGFLVPDQDVYTHGSQLVYSCDQGYKPVVDGWWQTVTCQDGKWSRQPECIDKKSCRPLPIQNGKYTVEEQLWFPEGFVLSTTCDTGYSHRSRVADAVCLNGSWSHAPVCEKKILACDEPPRKPNAVVVNQGYQAIYEADTELHFECEDGYAFEGAVPKKTIICRFGQWTRADPCVKKLTPNPDPAASGSQPGGAGGSSTGVLESAEQMTSISKCGQPPVIPNSEVVLQTRTFVKYQCAAYYTIEDPFVFCLSSGSWSKHPSCKETFCLVDTNSNPKLVNNGGIYLKDKENRRLLCTYRTIWNYYAEAQCNNGALTLGECCTRAALNVGLC